MWLVANNSSYSGAANATTAANTGETSSSSGSTLTGGSRSELAPPIFNPQPRPEVEQRVSEEQARSCPAPAPGPAPSVCPDLGVHTDVGRS